MRHHNDLSLTVALPGLASHPKAKASGMRVPRFLTTVTGLALLAAGLVIQPNAANAQTLPPWMNTALAPTARANLLLAAMTLDQKLQQLTGSVPEIVPEFPQCKGARHVTGIAALQIPTLRITNGPVGVGQNDCIDANTAPIWVTLPDGTVIDLAPYTHPSSAKATALPSATAVAASFDPAVATAFGDVIGTEMNNLALHVFEAPGVNMARLPILGRNFEYFGEDPFLTGTMGVAEVKAVQAKGLIGMAKHYVGNEQETNRIIYKIR